MLPRGSVTTDGEYPKMKTQLGLVRRTLSQSTAIALVGTLSAGAAWADGIVKIGVLAPMTGPASADGEEFVRGATLAIEEANAAGGVAGYTFEVVVADVKDGSANNVTSAVERLLSDPNIHYIQTGYASITNFEIDLMKEADMPFMLASPSGQTRNIVSPSPED
jgi:branched-chain amino acid transport system substrate-binding protein